MANNGENPDIHKYLKGLTGFNGLIGGRFFTVSYGLLGLSASALLTYSLVMIQFKIDQGRRSSIAVTNCTCE